MQIVPSRIIGVAVGAALTVATFMVTPQSSYTFTGLKGDPASSPSRIISREVASPDSVSGTIRTAIHIEPSMAQNEMMIQRVKHEYPAPLVFWFKAGVWLAAAGLVVGVGALMYGALRIPAAVLLAIGLSFVALSLLKAEALDESPDS